MRCILELGWYIGRRRGGCKIGEVMRWLMERVMNEMDIISFVYVH